ncbi:MAG TPA: serine/threonine-protein kinase [Thermoanaerobaculia bacterium]|jgi:serine/threonine protein kinase|nr:serine/threonine-protein kinase [Thermoanaerobaculia bacterium]
MLPLTPTKLGRYEITDEIGKGAMGVVYLARDPLIGRLVALKTFRIGYSVRDSEMEQFRIRFLREAQSAGILTHPNIVTIHDVVEGGEEGLAFIAMEYVRGTNLKLLLQGDQPLSLSFVLDAIAQVGDALDYAHSNRVVHRDVKPANILITTDNKVKITDFGIARLDSSNLTQEGQLLGTPNYMAPEQIQGKEVDHRADLFSLGVVLYEMLTRHKPFSGENLTVVSHRIVYDHFTPPQEFVKNLAPGLEPILNRALEKDPARRYQRARDMVDDLRRLVEADHQRSDLNETQSLASTMVLPPPPPKPQSAAAGAKPAPVPPPGAAKPSLFSRWRKEPTAPPPVQLRPPVPTPMPPAPPVAVLPAPALDATGTGDASGSTGGTVPPPAPDLSDTNATTEVPVLAPPPLPKAPARKGPMSQALLAAGLVVVFGVLAGGGFLLWRQGAARQPERTVAAAPVQPAPVVPAPSPPPALTPAVSPPAVPNLDAQLDFASRGLAAKHYDAAIAGAQTVLMIDPANLEAKKILTRAQYLQNRAKQKLAETPREPQPNETVAATATPVIPVTAVTRNPSDSSQAAATTATLRIHFVSDFPDGGVLIVYVNDKEKARLPVEASRGGFLGLRKSVQPHDASQSIEVPAGTVQLRVSVAATGRAASVRPMTGNFQGGVPRNLEVQLSADGKVDTSLR